uniref:M20_dimer domain-containing protein n=1 Tax=Rhabditophanes sp. KR3021 TaxID=114890 RepID=A0AC35TML5_9BILA
MIPKCGWFNVTDLLVSLMKIESTTLNEFNVGHALANFIEEGGWVARKQFIPNNDKRFNLLITKNDIDPKKIKFLFNSHLDTVPPYIEPTVRDGMVFGRGSNDAKGQVASMIIAAKKFVDQNKEDEDKIGLLFVVGEETDHVGMKKANSFNLEADYIVVGEPTENKFARLQKGAIKLELVCHGKAAHSGYPEKGVSAIEKLLDILNDIRNYDWPKDKDVGDTTLNIGFIEGGQALNALASNASAQLFFRVTTTTDEIESKMKEIIGGRCDMNVYGKNDPVHLSEPPKGYESKTVAFNTDLPFFEGRSQMKGCYLFGAGSITNAHSVDEFVKISDLESSIETYVNLVKHCLHQ